MSNLKIGQIQEAYTQFLMPLALFHEFLAQMHKGRGTDPHMVTVQDLPLILAFSVVLCIGALMGKCIGTRCLQNQSKALRMEMMENQLLLPKIGDGGPLSVKMFDV